MSIALCLGGAASLRADWAAALRLGNFDYVVACNDAGAIWPGHLDAWVTLHPEKLADWREQRHANGHPEASRYLVHGDNVPDWSELIEFRFPGQGDSGSSGLFTAKAALIDLGADRAVLAGVPLSPMAHFFDTATWEAAAEYRAVFETLRPEYRARIRSMSGWSAGLFGVPSPAWMATGSGELDSSALRMEMTPMTNGHSERIAYEPHPVSPERKAELRAAGYKILDVRFQLAAEGNATRHAAEAPLSEPAEAGGLTDDELRAAIEAATGKAPHHKTGRAKLLEQYAAAQVGNAE